MKRFKLLKQFALLPKVHSTGMRFLLITFMFFSSTQMALAEIACPTDDVRTNGPNGRYAYHFAEKASATCTNRVAIPANGVRVFSSKRDCGVGRFTVVAENNGGRLPDSLTCDNCTVLNLRDGKIALGTSANFRAYLKISGGTEDVRYDGTFTRSADSPSVCTLSGSFRGSTFGGDATRPTVSIAALTGPASGTYTAVITLSESSTDFDAMDLTLVNATATLSGSGSSYTAIVTPSGDGLVSVKAAADSFSDTEDNTNAVASNTVSATFSATQNIPVFGPFGLLAMFMGSLWFGRRHNSR